MYWLLLVIPGGLIALNVYFEKKRKGSNEKEQVQELFTSDGAANKAQDPKHSKHF
ncbi:hypothetical protein [Halobacillus salinus]|uniref:hypothetical protein n=1 Tax=Halobacillus salinus TaxID=192814 RepID=UPI001305310D|nr:hypothetical protein [Halobacillus salinus]